MLDENDMKQIEELFERCSKLMQETLDRVDAMEDVLYNKVLKPAEDFQNEYNLNLRKDDFRNKYGEKLNSLDINKIKAIEGDDFDVFETAFEGFDNDKSENKNGDEYIEKFISKVNGQLDRIGKAYGIGVEPTAEPTAEEEKKEEAEAPAEEEKKEEPEVEEKTEIVDVDHDGDLDEKKTTEVDEDKDGEPEVKVEEVKDEVKDDSEEEESEEDDPEEVEKDKEELEKEFEEMKKRGEI